MLDGIIGAQYDKGLRDLKARIENRLQKYREEEGRAHNKAQDQLTAHVTSIIRALLAEAGVSPGQLAAIDFDVELPEK